MPCLRLAGTVESALQQRAHLTHTAPTLRGAAAAAQLLAQRMRAALAAADLISR